MALTHLSPWQSYLRADLHQACLELNKQRARLCAKDFELALLPTKLESRVFRKEHPEKYLGEEELPDFQMAPLHPRQSTLALESVFDGSTILKIRVFLCELEETFEKT